MGLSKAYDELTDNPEFTDGLTLSVGESIVDDNGNDRITLDGTYGTYLKDDEGRQVIQAGWPEYTFSSYENRDILIKDEWGDFDAIKYTASDSAPGTLELTNAILTNSNTKIFSLSGNIPDGTDSSTDTVDVSEYNLSAGNSRIGNAIRIQATVYNGWNGSNAYTAFEDVLIRVQNEGESIQIDSLNNFSGSGGSGGFSLSIENPTSTKVDGIEMLQTIDLTLNTSGTIQNSKWAMRIDEIGVIN